MSQKKNEGIRFPTEIRVVGSYTDRLLSSILELYCWEELNIFRIIFPRKKKMCAKRKVVITFRFHLVFDVLFYKRKDCPLEGDSEATVNALSS